MSTVAITGASGYIGTQLLGFLEQDERVSRIVGIDVRDPRARPPKLQFLRRDVTQPFVQLFRDQGVTHAIHLAFVLNPIHDAELMRRIDLDGTEHFLAACEAASVGTILVASSVTAYGALPDNPVPLTEDRPVRGNDDYQYSSDKAALDRRCQAYAASHPGVAMKILRPAIVIGPHVDNYISRLLCMRPALTIAGFDPMQQYVHEDDVARAFHELLFAGPAGAYNVAGDGWMPVSRVAAILGSRPMPLPYGLVRVLVALLWHLRVKGLGDAPPGVLNYVRYPMVASNDKIKRAAGFRFRHTSEEALRALAAAKGRA